MNTLQQVQQHPASVDAYIRHGWSLVPIPMGTKGPTHRGWNQRESALRSQADLPPGFGIGLAHAYSGTMALDIDNWSVASGLLLQHDIDIQALYDAPDAVIVHSGRQGRGKLLYTMPFGLALPSKKISGDGAVAYELRCATSNGLTLQDVLPPSIHPETRQPYQWAGRGHWTRLPIIPQPLLDLWQSLLQQDQARTIATDGPVDASWDEIHKALDAIPADCSRDEWINVGMALHWAGTQTDQIEHAYVTWNEWSSQSQSKYPGEREIQNQWRSFRPDKASSVKLGTLFHIAKQHGWSRPMPDATELFSKVEFPTLSPLDILDSLRPKPPRIDLDLFPSVLRQRAVEVSNGIGCDPIIPLFAGMAAICGVIDARIRLELMPGFKVPPLLWLMTLGDPADKKTPGSEPMLSPLKALELEDRPRFQKEFLDYEGREAAYSSAKKSFLEWSASPDALFGGDQAPHVPDAPTQPVPLKITVADITSQKLVRHAAERPRGLLCYLDEMNGWVKKITDIAGGGEDRSAWVVAYESRHYEMDRVGAGSIHADNYAVSIYGNMQPAVYKANFGKLASDGLLQRFIPVVIDPKAAKVGHPVPDYMTNAAEWENMLRLTYALPVQTYRLSSMAYDAYREFQHWYEDRKQDERILKSGNEYMQAFGKLEGLVGRLSLVFHVMTAPFDPEVSVATVERVIRLVRGYVIPAYQYTLGGGLANVVQNDFDEWVIDWIVQHSADMQHVTLSDVKRASRRQLIDKTEWQKDQAVMDAMLLLEGAGWVILVENEPHKRRMTWAINPGLSTMFKDYRIERLKAKQRHLDYAYRYSYDKGGKRQLVKGYDPETMDDPDE